MDRDQGKVVSGSVFDAPLHSGSVKYKEGRMPHVGQHVSFRDGREFVFVSTYNNDFVAGEIVATQDCSTAEIANLCTAAAVGANTIIVDITGQTLFGNAATLAKDRMEDGYIVTSNNTGEGYCYKVKKNTVQDANAKVTFTLYDTVQVAIDTTTDIFMIGPRYHGVVEGTATLKPVGVCVKPTTAGTNTRWEYFWTQKKGMAAVHVETASGIAIGEAVTAGASGGCIPPGGDQENVIGIAAGPPTADDDKLAVWLNIE